MASLPPAPHPLTLSRLALSPPATRGSLNLNSLKLDKLEDGVPQPQWPHSKCPESHSWVVASVLASADRKHSIISQVLRAALPHVLSLSPRTSHYSCSVRTEAVPSRLPGSICHWVPTLTLGKALPAATFSSLSHSLHHVHDLGFHKEASGGYRAPILRWGD